MRSSRLLSCVVVIPAAVRLAMSFVITANTTKTSAFTPVRHVYRSGPTSARTSSATCHDNGRRHTCTGGSSSLRMGSKKKRKLEKEALKSAGGGPTKTMAREAQTEADALAEGLLEQCVASKRDMGAISNTIDSLRSMSATLRPTQSPSLNRDWRLIFASDDDAISAVGTGLHKLPLTRMQDFFLTLDGNSSLRTIQAIEVLRVLGPFPNLRNTLMGQCKSTGSDTLNIRYTSMIDGTGKKTGSSFTGEQDRVVDVSLAFVGQKALVFTASNSQKKGANTTGSLVFVKEDDLDKALAELRVEGVEADQE